MTVTGFGTSLVCRRGLCELCTAPWCDHECHEIDLEESAA